MVSNFLFCSALLALCVTIHALVLTAILRWIRRSPAFAEFHFWSATWLLIRIAWWTILAHMLEIAVWAFFFSWQGVFADFESSLYFSLVTYTTVGYGDVVATTQWRVVSAVEGLVGILMCGWSTGFFFALVNRLFLSTRTQSS